MNKYIFLMLLSLILASTAYAESYTFSDTTAISVPEYINNGRYETGGTANDVVSSSINVSGTTGTITDLNVTINGLYSEAFIDMTFVLVGPDNTAVVLASNAGGAYGSSSNNIPTVDLTFDDESDNVISQAQSLNDASKNQYKKLNKDSYQLAAYDMAYFYSAHSSWYSVLDPVAEGYFGNPRNFASENALSAFDDISADGIWQLLAFDNYITDATSYSGWTLSFVTSDSKVSGAVPEPAEWALLILTFTGITGIYLLKRKQILV